MRLPEVCMDRETLEKKQRFFRGEGYDAYTFMGVHPLKDGNGFSFRVWAPRARSVRLVGDFNFWNTEEIFLQKDPDGVWEGESRAAKTGDRYQYYIEKADGGFVYKSDPYGFRFSPLPDTASVIPSFEEFQWTDAEYQAKKAAGDPLNIPVNIYEVHLGSWKRHPDGRLYSYRDLALSLVPYLQEMHYTHLELLPVMEHPFDGSWGYQVTGYFAPTHRYGAPEDLKFLIDSCHAAGVGVILDWVPAHFPKDESGLYEFDGTPAYEVDDPEMCEHKEWGTRIFDYARYEVSSFLISSAVFWLKEYHADGIRVDAVASMLYLDYAREHFKPNCFGGNYNLAAIDFFKRLSYFAFQADPKTLFIAEESTAFPMVTRPGYDGGLGFNFKWNMGWMNDILRYMATDPIFRKEVHKDLVFSFVYAYAENYILPLSHDEVVHGKGSLIGKMPGSYDDKFRNLRALYGLMLAHPGKKLNFMGNEFAQFAEWDYKKELDWFLLGYETHRGMQNYVRELNAFYLSHPAFWDNDSSPASFSLISGDDRENSVIAFRRISREGKEIVCVFNFCPVARFSYRVGLPQKVEWRVVFSSDPGFYSYEPEKRSSVYAEENPMHGLPFSASFSLAPLSATYYEKTI